MSNIASIIFYYFLVYGPLSVRLVQQLEAPGWRNLRDVLDTLPGNNSLSGRVIILFPLTSGPTFEDTQQVAGGGAGRRGEGARKVVLVFYVGGVTMAEVAALRWLSQVSKSYPT